MNDIHDHQWLKPTLCPVTAPYVKNIINGKKGRPTILRIVRIITTSADGSVLTIMADGSHQAYVKFVRGPAITRFEDEYHTRFTYASTNTLIYVTKADCRQVDTVGSMTPLVSPGKNHVILEVTDFEVYLRYHVPPVDPRRKWIYGESDYQGRIDVGVEDEDMVEVGNQGGSTYSNYIPN